MFVTENKTQLDFLLIDKLWHLSAAQPQIRLGTCQKYEKSKDQIRGQTILSCATNYDAPIVSTLYQKGP